MDVSRVTDREVTVEGFLRQECRRLVTSLEESVTSCVQQLREEGDTAKRELWALYSSQS